MWTDEMKIIYEIAKNKIIDKNTDEDMNSNWKQYDGNEYVEKYFYNTPQEFQKRLLDEIGENRVDYMIPLTISIMKKRPVDEDFITNMEDKTDTKQGEIPDYIYSF